MKKIIIVYRLKEVEWKSGYKKYKNYIFEIDLIWLVKE